MRCIYSSITIFIALVLLSHPVHAIREIRTRPHLIHTAQHFYGDPTLNNVYYYKFIDIPYKNGQVVLSSTPDGTGTVSFSHTIEVYGSYPSSGSFRYAPGCGPQEMPPLDITQFITGTTSKGLLIRYKKELCPTAEKIDGQYIDHTSVGDLYAVVFEDTADAPDPFLRLPWDYESKGLSFYDVAFKINSYFDHEYPLLSIGSVNEPSNAIESVISFDSSIRDIGKKYSSHDGYDWGRGAMAFNGESVLAAATGTATYTKGVALGNAIFIDHQNGYQTRYYHLQDDGLVTRSSIEVQQGQHIGRIGTTGNSKAPHIHFMVIHDKNGDGNFADNIPDGLVDPFGWHPYDPDPWESYVFTQNGEQKTGSRSFYLWQHPFQKLQTTLKPDGNSFTLNRYQLRFPKGIVTEDAIIEAYLKPATLRPDSGNLGNAIEINVHDGFGNLITTFNKAWELIISFSAFDISRYKQDTLAIFSRSEGETEWQEETTAVNLDTKMASAMINHLSEFTIQGEKLDAIAPVTVATVSGVLLDDNIYSADSGVTINLSATDEPSTQSLGIDFILYQVNGGEWTPYDAPIELTAIGNHVINFYAQDRDFNDEDIQSMQFTITAPPTPTPSATPTPSPTLTSTPTPTATMTPVLSPTATPEDVLGKFKEKPRKKNWWKWFRKKWEKWNRYCVILNAYGCTKT